MIIFKKMSLLLGSLSLILGLTSCSLDETWNNVKKWFDGDNVEPTNVDSETSESIIKNNAINITDGLNIKALDGTKILSVLNQDEAYILNSGENFQSFCDRVPGIFQQATNEDYIELINYFDSLSFKNILTQQGVGYHNTKYEYCVKFELQADEDYYEAIISFNLSFDASGNFLKYIVHCETDETSFDMLEISQFDDGDLTVGSQCYFLNSVETDLFYNEFGIYNDEYQSAQAKWTTDNILTTTDASNNISKTELLNTQLGNSMINVMFNYSFHLKSEITAPVIAAPSIIEVNYENPITVDKMIKLYNIKATDNVDGDVSITYETTYIIPSSGNVEEGKYNVRFIATDSADNTSFVDSTIVVSKVWLKTDSDNSDLIGQTVNHISSNFMYDTCEELLTAIAKLGPTSENGFLKSTIDLECDDNEYNYKLVYYTLHFDASVDDNSETTGLSIRNVIVLYKYLKSKGFVEYDGIPTSDGTYTGGNYTILFDSIPDGDMTKELSFEDLEFEIILPDIYTIVSAESGYHTGELNDDGTIDYVSSAITSFTASNMSQFTLVKFRGEGDIYAPEIINTNKKILIDVSKPLTINEIFSKVEVYDHSRYKFELISTTYNPELLVLGEHSIEFKIIDEFGNITTDDSFTLNVYDNEGPTIEGDKIYSTSYDEAIDIENIIDSLIVYDNYYNAEDLNVYWYKDNYTGNERKPGSYNVYIEAKDKSNNISKSFLITINVYDNKEPIITAPKILDVSSNEKLSLDDIKNLIYVYDELDGLITYQIDMSEYLNNTINERQCSITIEAVDKAENVNEFSIIVNITNALLSSHEVNEYAIQIGQYTKLTDAMMKTYLEQVNFINAVDVQMIDGEIGSDAGDYKMRCVLNDNTVKSFTVRVGSVETEIIDSKDSFIDFSKISSWGWPQWLIIGSGVVAIYIVFKLINKKIRR